MRVVFAGTPEVSVPSLRALLASRHEVVAVVTRSADRLAASGGCGSAHAVLPAGEWRNLLSENNSETFSGPALLVDLLVDLPVALLVRTP